MRKGLVGLVLVAAIGSGVWLMLGGPPAETVPSAPRSTVEQVERVAESTVRAEAATRGFGRGEARTAKLRAQAVEREAMQQRIEERLARRAATTERATAEVQAARRGHEVKSEEAAPAGNLVDQTGKHGYLLRVMNEELMPLAHECQAMARERRPDLMGMLAVDVSLVGDAEVGGVVEEVVAAGINEVKDAELLECVRESLMAVTLPPPPEGGRDGFMLSMPMAPE